MKQASSSLPAILGGPPIRPEGPPDWPFPDPAVAAALNQMLADGSWGKYHGPHVAKLADFLAAGNPSEFVHLCSSGTAAVELALRGLQVGPGDEVILGAYDFKGNFQDVLTVGAAPVLVDVLSENCTLDPAQLPAAIGPKTKAILVSHLHGGIARVPEIVRIAGECGIPVVEDTAQMPGALVYGKTAGTWGDVGVFSFGGSKLLTSGRGGAVFTSHSDVAQRIKLYVQRGNDAYPLSEMQAAVLLPQCLALDAANRQRAAAAAWLSDRLDHRIGLTPFKNESGNMQPGYYKLGLHYEAAALAGLDRETFAAAVRAEGIALDPGFRALHLTHSARRFRAVGDLPHATRADETVLTLHHPVLLKGPEALAQVLEAVEKVARHAAAILEKKGQAK